MTFAIQCRRALGLVGFSMLFTSPMHVGAQGAPLPRRGLQTIVTVGGDDAAGDSYTLAEVRDVRASSDGTMYVLDSKDFVVRVYGTDGKFLRRFGQRGSGPGEFTTPASLVVTDTSVSVYDFRARRHVLFSNLGRHIATRTETAGFGEAILPVSHGHHLKSRSASVSSDSGFSPTEKLTLERRASGRIDTLAAIRTDGLTFRSGQGFGMLTSGFGNGGAWGLSGDTLLAIADGYTGVVRWYTFADSGAVLKRTEKLGRTANDVSAADVAAMEARLRKGTPMLASPDVQFVNPPKKWSIADRVIWDSQGGLWIRTPAAATAKTVLWTVMPARGSGFEVELPAKSTIHSIRDGRVYTSGETELGTPIVRVYRIPTM